MGGVWLMERAGGWVLVISGDLCLGTSVVVKTLSSARACSEVCCRLLVLPSRTGEFVTLTPLSRHNLFRWLDCSAPREKNASWSRCGAAQLNVCSRLLYDCSLGLGTFHLVLSARNSVLPIGDFLTQPKSMP